MMGGIGNPRPLTAQLIWEAQGYVSAPSGAIFDTTVDTLAVFKALIGAPNAVLIKGRGVAYDGWGGLFVKIAGSVTAGDDALVIRRTAGGDSYKRLYDGRIHSRWCATGDGDADDTTGLNTFFAFASAGLPIFVDRPAAYYKVTAGLAAVTGDNIDIDGDGRGTVIRYLNAGATAPTILTIGSDTPYERARVRGFTIESATVLTGGYGLRIRNYQHVDFDLWCGDEFSEGWKLYNAAWFDACTAVYLNTSHFYGSAASFVWTSGVEMHCQNAFVKGFTSAGGTGIGIHVGGGCGGFNAENLTQLHNDIGLLVDTSVVAAGNAQIFMGSADLDSNKTAAIRLDDALGTSLFYSQDDAWLASSSAGSGLVIANWLNGKVRVGGGRIYNHSADGILIADNTIDLRVTDDSIVEANAGYGINSSVAVAIVSSGKLVSNTSGNYHSNVTPTDSNGFSSRTLAFYAEGTWTPTILGSVTPGSQTYTAQEGYYIRTGKMVHCWGRVVLSALDVATAGAVQIGGLPFAAKTTTAMGFAGSIGGASNLTHAAGYTQYGLVVGGGKTVIDVLELGKDAAANISLIQSGIANNSAFTHFSVTYQLD